MKFNKYQFLSSCIESKNVNVMQDVVQDVKPLYSHKILSQYFFKCFCQTICNTEKRLDMHGHIVYKKIKRNLQDVDIPALLIFLKKNQDITHLNLASNSISDAGFINLIDHFLLYKNIQELDIQNNSILDYGINYMLEFGKNLELKSLNLRANKFSNQVSKSIALFLLENKHIYSLNIADVNQTASSLIYFMMVLSADQEVSNKCLKSLDISRPNPGYMYYFDSAHFAEVIGHMLKYNTTLIALYLQKYNFSCHDIENMMFNTKYNNSLYLLDLGCNNIGDHGINHISVWLAKRPALKILILSRNIITDHGARSLSFIIPFSKLIFLDISYNKITDDGMVNILYTLKKSPLLRQLKIFGNCIGHPTAKIVNRMLISQVFNQENIDIRPYRVDHKWYLARYEGDCHRKEYYNIPYRLSSEAKSKISSTMTHSIRKYYKYTYSTMTEIKLQHSIVTLISKILSQHHVTDCKCCYCLKCEAPHYDKQCRDANHPHTCTCCKCKRDESSDWSIDKSVLNRVMLPSDPVKNIEFILKHVDSITRENISRWINIKDDILKEDLKFVGESNTTKEGAKEIISCNCSWVQLSIPILQKCLEESFSKDLVIIPKDNFIYLNKRCKACDTETSSSDHCTNI